MKKILLLGCLAASATLTGCVVTPVETYPVQGYYEPRPAYYTAPAAAVIVDRPYYPRYSGRGHRHWR